MPVTYAVDHHRQRIHAVASGALNLADLAAYIGRRVKDGVYDYDQLIEVSDVTIDVDSQEVIDTVLRAREHLGKRPIPYTAVVVRPGSATYQLTSEIATLFDFEGAIVKIVDSVHTANEWLDEMRSGQKKPASSGDAK